MSHEVGDGVDLTVDSLYVRMGGRPALEDTSLKLSPGELVGMIGPNGAGKTTLLRAVLGLIAIDTGTIRVGGQPPARARARIGYVPQRHEFTWDFPITVHGAVTSARVATSWLRRSGAADRRAVDEAVERAGLTSLRRRPVGELSGGQRQRVLVARALARRPGLLLLDEPFTGVDVPTQELLTALFTDIAADGGTVLMTTHDLAQAATMCGRLCLLNRSVVADGPPAELRDPQLWLRAFGVSSSPQLLGILGGVR